MTRAFINHESADPVLPVRTASEARWRALTKSLALRESSSARMRSSASSGCLTTRFWISSQAAKVAPGIALDSSSLVLAMAVSMVRISATISSSTPWRCWSLLRPMTPRNSPLRL